MEPYDENTGLYMRSEHAMCLLPPKCTYGKGFPERDYRILCPDLELKYDTH